MVAADAEEHKQEQAVQASAANDAFAGKLDPNSNKFTYEVLKSSFPEGVAATKKEYYMSTEEFASVLGMSVAEWDALKQWKKDTKKKAVGLF